jgi:hypothetical protein
VASTQFELPQRFIWAFLGPRLLKGCMVPRFSVLTRRSQKGRRVGCKRWTLRCAPGPFDWLCENGKMAFSCFLMGIVVVLAAPWRSRAIQLDPSFPPRNASNRASEKTAHYLTQFRYSSIFSILCMHCPSDHWMRSFHPSPPHHRCPPRVRGVA